MQKRLQEGGGEPRRAPTRQGKGATQQGERGRP